MKSPITIENIDLLKEYNSAQRKIACKNHFGYFITYYFSHYVKYKFADFHYEMINNFHKLIDKDIDELAWIMFRESAKTSFAKIGVIYLIVYRLADYINVDSYDKSNAERILFDVVYELQTNRRLINDFGELFNLKRDFKQVSQKRISDFITNETKENGKKLKGIRVEAHSTQEPVRGRLHGDKRPDFLIIDDFETNNTIRSEQITNNISEHINEFKTGLDAIKSRILYLGNYISEYGNIQKIINRSKKDDRLILQLTPIIQNGKPTWESKYCLEGEDKDKKSIQSIKQALWSEEDGDTIFMAEMMCQPIDFKSQIFKKEHFKTINWEDIKIRDLDVCITIDTPSTREGNKVVNSDYCGFCINFIDSNYWNFKAWREKLTPTQIINRIIEKYQEVKRLGIKIIRVGWEDTAFTRGLEMLMKKEQEERNEIFTIQFLKPAGRKKEDRIKSGLLYRYEQGMIRHINGECYDLEAELLRFPSSKNDDCSDACSYQQDLVKIYKRRSAYENEIIEDKPDFEEIGL
jgi:hypothetical protein